MKCRIVYKPDGQVSIIHPAPNARMPKETENAFLKRVFEKTMSDSGFKGLPYEDVDKSTLPQDRKDRDKWRGNKESGIYVDHTIVTEQEKRQAVEDQLDAELAKDEPNSVKVIGLQRKLDKRDY